jgi:hypothetical protein
MKADIIAFIKACLKEELQPENLSALVKAELNETLKGKHQTRTSILREQEAREVITNSLKTIDITPFIEPAMKVIFAEFVTDEWVKDTAREMVIRNIKGKLKTV